MFDDDLVYLARRTIFALKSRGVMLVSAESCTGGLIAALMTEVPGSSAVFDRGFVTYSNDAKADLLGVPETLIKRVGAVSSDVARAMAAGALARSQAGIAVSVTGIAGPDGATSSKPVGLVYIAVAQRGDQPVSHEYKFGSIGRVQVRISAVREALRLVEHSLGERGVTALA